MDKKINDKVNEVFNIALYLQLMGSFVPGADFRKIKKIVEEVHFFFTTFEEQQIKNRINEIEKDLQVMSNLFLKRFPNKKMINEIATCWNQLFKNDNSILESGIEYGWLEELMDLSNFQLYDFVPYHFKIGLGAHKGYYGIEEEFLLKDSFDVLLKAEDAYNLLLKYGKFSTSNFEKQKHKEFNKKTYIMITNLKYEVAAYSRLCIISFYAFIECFVNSVGYSYLKRNHISLSENEKEILIGKRKGRYLQLQSKIERFQKIINSEKKVSIITSDEIQMPESFRLFFSTYENLRNASVHYAPSKEKIWLKPEDWLQKAKEFTSLSLEIGRMFWKACYPQYDDPQYLGKLEYERFYTLSKNKIKDIEKIKNMLSN